MCDEGVVRSESEEKGRAVNRPLSGGLRTLPVRKKPQRRAAGVQTRIVWERLQSEEIRETFVRNFKREWLEEYRLF